MDVVGQMREGELRTDQLEIGKKYRMEHYMRFNPGEQHRLIDQNLVRFRRLGVWGDADINMDFTIIAPNTRIFRSGEDVSVRRDTNPKHNFYYRFFQTAQDRIVPQFEQRALQKVFEQRLDKESAYGLTKNLLGPSKKSGGRKYKTRQTKIRRKNRTKKNRRRTHRR
jgi:hypothetical protein